MMKRIGLIIIGIVISSIVFGQNWTYKITRQTNWDDISHKYIYFEIYHGNTYKATKEADIFFDSEINYYNIEIDTYRFRYDNKNKFISGTNLSTTDCSSLNNAIGISFNKFIVDEYSSKVINSQFNQDLTYGTLTDDRDGKVYKTIKIGNQTWMAENLAYKTNSGSWAYNNNESNVAIFGRLYNWETAKNVCPSGWHLPSDTDFKVLINEIGGEKAFEKLTLNGISGFNVIFGGWRNNQGEFHDIKSYAQFWSSSNSYDCCAWDFNLNSKNQKVELGNLNAKNWASSVRCIKD